MEWSMDRYGVIQETAWNPLRSSMLTQCILVVYSIAWEQTKVASCMHQVSMEYAPSSRAIPAKGPARAEKCPPKEILKNHVFGPMRRLHPVAGWTSLYVLRIPQQVFDLLGMHGIHVRKANEAVSFENSLEMQDAGS
ncbi:hypothetical protein ACFQRK_05835 [Parapedobacter sp. GCM10030251]|uniref:hypothetical protein n=1 Tax=Parapedobacter sp. GCM10030251 TaxID=3273419 RepID=UPI003617E0E5